jgi:hypothetical protein
MTGRLVAGVLAGTAGTLALEATSYADMLWRGRPPSELPATTVRVFLRRRGITLGADGNDERDRHRESALAALGGYAVGLSVGIAGGLALPVAQRLPRPVLALALGALAMAAGNLGPILAGTTDPTEWDLPAWLSDVVPHVAYGAAAAATLHAVCRAPRR